MKGMKDIVCQATIVHPENLVNEIRGSSPFVVFPGTIDIQTARMEQSLQGHVLISMATIVP